MRKLRAHWKPLTAILALLLAWSLWYSRPVDIYALAPEMGAPDHIYLDVHKLSSNAPSSHRTFYPEDRSWDVLLERLEALRFRRPPWNPALQFLGSFGPTSRMAHPGDWHIVLHATGRTGDVQIQFLIDRWVWSSPYTGRHLTLWVEDSRETGTALAEQLLPLFD